MRVISVVTLGVSDLERSTEFYESIDFEKSNKSGSSITWFRTGGTVLALYPRHLLAEDIGIPDTDSGFSGATFALCLRSIECVDNFIEKVRSAGGRVVKQPQHVFWGGYSSYFADPDGHFWEVAYNPFTPVDESGNLRIDE